MTERGSAAAYVCRDFTCRQPVTTVGELARRNYEAADKKVEFTHGL